MTWKSPRPTSCTGYMSGPPPGSGSPLSGQSSSKTNTVTVDVGSGLGSTFTVTLVGSVHVLVVPLAVQAGLMGAPPIVWPHVAELWPVAVWTVEVKQLAFGADVFPVLNGFAASPG